MITEFRLIIRSGPNSGQVIKLEKDDLILGRDLHSDIVLTDPEVSRRHARLFQKGSAFMLEDLGSTNGTFVEGQRLTGPYLLQPGETIHLGENCILVFESIEVDPDATKVSNIGEKPVQEPAPAEQISQRPTISPMEPIQTPKPTPVEQPKPQPKPQIVGGDYVGSIPESPVPKKKWWIWLVAGLALLAVGCLIVFIIVDLANLYCVLFPGVVNLFVPGYCR